MGQEKKKTMTKPSPRKEVDSATLKEARLRPPKPTATPIARPEYRLDPSRDIIDRVNQELSEFESLSRSYQSQHEKFIKANQTAVHTRERLLPLPVSDRARSALPDQALKDLQAEVRGLQQEKEGLKAEVKSKTLNFRNTLEKEVRKVEHDWQDKVKKASLQRKQIRGFTNQVMNETDSPIWMIAYSDMATLLLTFFILYYSIASMNVAKFKAAILGDAEAPIGLIELVDSVKIKKSIVELTGMQTSDVLADLRSSSQDFAGALEVVADNGKVIFRVPAKILFSSGSADLQKAGRPVLDEIIKILKKYPQYQINIQGHTDDVPISTTRFPSNWELSATRATSVLRHFVDREIPPERLTATGFSDTLPLFSNETQIGRSKNRRVEFVLEKK
ncbi:MAG: flagellar motor protein MotB [Nitrospinaceae bacterium]|nr:MAG: flagellar motor protein MotB [Nitrospinaceae bacterium]